MHRNVNCTQSIFLNLTDNLILLPKGEKNSLFTKTSPFWQKTISPFLGPVKGPQIQNNWCPPQRLAAKEFCWIFR